VPVGSTGFGFTLGSTAGANINKSERATGTPADTNGSTGLSQSDFDYQRAFANSDFIHELAFGSEQVTTLIGPTTDQIWANGYTPSPANGHTIESQLNAILVTEIQHETITKMAGHETVESKVSDNGAFINSDSIAGIPNLDLGLQSTPPGGNGSISDLEVFDLQKFSLLSLQPGTNLLQVPELQGIQVLPIVNVTAPLGQNKDQQNQRALQHNLSFGNRTLSSDRKSVKRSDLFSPLLSAHLAP